MRIIIDTDLQTLIEESDRDRREVPLYSTEAFEILSRQWVKVGWNQKYGYTFSWLGCPVIQLPEDMVRVQEVIHRLQPDVIIETGIAHGGSLIFYASLLKVMGKGRVIGVDVEIREKNRRAIESHPLAPLITLIEGDSAATQTVQRVQALLGANDRALVILDSCHNRAHVLRELTAYHSFVAANSYIVATDGIMEDLADVPRGQADWAQDNPQSAVREFLSSHPDFVLETPAWIFNESRLKQNVTHWPNAWLRRVR